MGERKITYRQANIEDAELLFQWKNDPVTIANSLTKRGVSMEEHIQWLQGIMTNENRLLYIMEVDGQPAGQLRLDVCIEKSLDRIYKAEISYGLDEKFRGQGLGEKLLLQAEQIAKEKKLAKLTAEVLPHNAASLHLFRKLDYKEAEKDEVTFFSKEIL